MRADEILPDTVEYARYLIGLEWQSPSGLAATLGLSESHCRSALEVLVARGEARQVNWPKPKGQRGGRAKVFYAGVSNAERMD